LVSCVAAWATRCTSVDAMLELDAASVARWSAELAPSPRRVAAPPMSREASTRLATMELMVAPNSSVDASKASTRSWITSVASLMVFEAASRAPSMPLGRMRR